MIVNSNERQFSDKIKKQNSRSGVNDETNRTLDVRGTTCEFLAFKSDPYCYDIRYTIHMYVHSFNIWALEGSQSNGLVSVQIQDEKSFFKALYHLAQNHLGNLGKYHRRPWSHFFGNLFHHLFWSSTISSHPWHWKFCFFFHPGKGWRI